MTSKLSRWMLKYFYFTNVLLGFVVVSVNHRDKRTTLSWLKIIYATFWFIFFATYFLRSCNETYQGFENIYFDKESKISNTVIIEVAITYVVVLLFALHLIKSHETANQFYSKLLKLTSEKNLTSDPPTQLTLLALFGELCLGFFFLFHWVWVSWTSWEISSVVHLVSNCYLQVFPVALLSRVSLFLAFLVDMIRQLVVILNDEFREALKLSENFENQEKLNKKFDEINRFYSQILEVIKLFEQNFGTVVVILQCECLIVGVNQVKFELN